MQRIFYLFTSLLLYNAAKSQTPELMLPIGHTMEITSVEFSPDARFVLTASIDNTVKVWDTKSGRLLRNFQAPEPVNFARFIPGMKSVVAGFSNNTTRIWDLKTGNILRDLKEHTEGGNGEEGVRSVSFSPDGKLMLIVSEFDIIKIWEVKTGRLIRDFTSAKAGTAIFLNNSDVALSVSQSTANGYENKITAYNISTGRTVQHRNAEQLFAREGPRGFEEAHRNFLIERLCFPVTMNDINMFFLNRTNKYALVNQDDGYPAVWDLEKCQKKIVMDQFPEVTEADFSIDNKLVASVSENIATIWDLETGRIISELTGYSIPVISSVFSPSSDRVLTVHGDGTAGIWDLHTGRLTRTLSDHSGRINDATFSKDGKWLATAADDSTVIIYDASGNKTTVIREEASVDKVVISPTNSFIISSTYEGGRLWTRDAIDLGTLISFRTEMIPLIKFTEKEDAFYVSYENEFYAWSTADGNLIDEKSTNELKSAQNGHAAYHKGGRYTPDGKYFLEVEGTWRPSVHILNVARGKKVRTLTGHTGVVVDAAYSWDGKYVITGGSDNLAILWNAATGAPLKKLHGHQFYVHSVGFSPDGKYMLTSAGDNTTRVWTLPDGKLIATFFALGEEEYFIILPDNYFTATKNAAALVHYVTPDLRFIPFSQLDAKYNRPDLVLKAFNSPDSALIAAFKKAYEKRIKRLGISGQLSQVSVDVPKAEISNRDQISPLQTSGTLDLRIRASGINPIANLNVWINETPLYGIKGIRSGAVYVRTIDTTLTVALSEGPNVIEVSVNNVNGAESYRMPLHVNYAPSIPIPGKFYFLGIGINKFQQPGHDLSWSVKDIRDLSAALREKYGDNISIDTLFDENVTVEKVSALKRKLQSSGVNDKVIVAYSGHGLLSKDFDYYLSTYNVNFDKPELGGLPYEVLESLLDSIPARQKLMLIDACHSGEVDKEEMEKYVMVEKSLEDSGTKSDRKPVPKDGVLGMKNSFELMQELFVNVGRSTGATVISAAAGTQFAQEKGTLQNGVFTYSILEYMKMHPTATVSELRQYVNKRVSELTQGMQVPTTRSETRAVDWKVW